MLWSSLSADPPSGLETGWFWVVNIIQLSTNIGNDFNIRIILQFCMLIQSWDHKFFAGVISSQVLESSKIFRKAESKC